MRKLAVLAALAACGPTSYIAKVWQEDGTLYVQRCGSGLGCVDEAVGDAAAPDLSHAPIELDRGMVSKSLDSVKPDVQRCGAAKVVLDPIWVHVKVTPLGQVDQVFVDHTEDAQLAECVALALRAAHFPRTQKGGGFHYSYAL